MGKSKEKEILELFFNYPTKHWHFKAIKEIIPIADNKISKWLKRFQKEGLINRIKPRREMPYYIANHESAHYRNTKKLFAFTKLHESGFLDYLTSLEKANTIILFGSLTRSDWYNESDIDLFIYGDIDHLNAGIYLSKLHREIQIFSGKNEEDLKQMGPALLRNILKGITLKGDIPIEVIKHATI